MEFAFGMDPRLGTATNAPGNPQLPQPVVENDHLVLRFTPPAQAAGLIYGAVSSATLTSDSWTAVTNTGTAPEHVYSVPITSDGPKFMKITVKE
ncbi:MAG TPA: hypothetical protein VK956_03345 [Verrucomicrobium sp.]|nr:hypothetical protein [Verrucomicrobium sp.]